MNKHYIFGTRGNISSQTRYDYNSPGAGFVTEKEWKEQLILQIFEINSGFVLPYWYKDEYISVIESDEGGCYINSDKQVAELWERDNGKQPGGERNIPLYFKASLPEQGNYRVTVAFTARTDEPEFKLFVGRRHLMWFGAIKKGQKFKQTFTVNLCDVIPNSKGTVYTDTTLDIAVTGRCPVLGEIWIEKTVCPTIYLAGDSTMADYGADYPYHPAACYGGWGQALAAWLNGSVAVCNQAHNGRTTETFCSEGHFDIVKKHICSGDYYMMQFGHNDQKHVHLQADNGYPVNLSRFVQEIREKGAFPVIITPIARNTWKETDEGVTYNDLLYDHSEACFKVGRELGVPVLDIHAASMEDVKRLGRDASKMYYYPGDYTHTNDYGAYRAAGYVAYSIQQITRDFPEYHLLADAVTEGFGIWEPQGNTPLLKKPARLSDAKDADSADNSDSEDHQAEKDGSDGLTQLLEAVRQARQQDS